MMLNEETKRKLRLLKIGEYIEALELQEQNMAALELSFDERFQLLTDEVFQRKYNERVQRLLKIAKLRWPKADVSGIYYDPRRPVKKELITELATCNYIENHKSVIIHGYSSTGKTYLACALAREACRHQYRTRYVRTSDLLAEYDEKSVLSGGLERMLTKYTNFNVLVLDEWLTEDMSSEELGFLFELSDRRYDKTTTIFCTLYDRNEWVEQMHQGSKAESITERFIHDAIDVYTGDLNMREIYTNTGTKRC